MPGFTSQTIPLQQRALSIGQCSVGMNLPGQRGWYRVNQLLTRTAANTIYLAIELNTRRRVIIKESAKARCGDQHPCSELLQEGLMLDRLEQARIPAPRRLDTFVFRGYTYLVMTYIVGKTLAALQSAERLDDSSVLNIMIQICHICQRLHALGYVHHDVKPENIIVQPQGVALLIDYGSARSIRPTGDQQLDVTGTWGFMSLEQLRGEARPSNDLFAIGHTLETALLDPRHRYYSVTRRATAPLDRRYSTLDQLRRALVWLQYLEMVRSTCTDLIHGSVPIVHRMLLATLIVLSLLIVRDLTSGSIGATGSVQLPPLQPIFAGEVAAAQRSLALIPPRSSTHVPPVDRILACYQRYQSSRVVAFAQLDVRHLDCVVPESPLWQRIAVEIASLQQSGYSREITIHSSINSVTKIEGATATLTVQKDEIRRDRLTDCSGAQAAPTCHPDFIEHDRFSAAFVLQNVSGTWQLHDVTFVLPQTL